jgi:hypothetical protein
MHRVAEEGIAAHWRYKEGDDFPVSDIRRYSWTRQLLEWQENLQDPQEFLHSLKEDLFTTEMYVFTPNGDLLNFPTGSTVVDFAYRIQSEVGHRCSGARVNGQLVSSNTCCAAATPLKLLPRRSNRRRGIGSNGSKHRAPIESEVAQGAAARAQPVMGREILEHDRSAQPTFPSSKTKGKSTG